tara:strand:- start:37 stop:390 length:354 start_codon:yes stop_codon:yes gene_type:complete
MAIPSGSGTEVLKRATATGDFDGIETILTVASNHIYTILSISICESASANEVFWLSMTDASNSNREIYILREQAVNSNETFILNDKFVLSSGDTLKLQSGSTCDVDVLISYIDQDWS